MIIQKMWYFFSLKINLITIKVEFSYNDVVAAENDQTKSVEDNCKIFF